MAFGLLYPRYVARRTFGLGQAELVRAAKLALNDLHWRYRIVADREFHGQIPMTNWSWHHDFRVTFPDNGLVEMTSQSAYQEILFDFGRNKGNVETFFVQMEQVITGAQFESVL